MVGITKPLWNKSELNSTTARQLWHAIVTLVPIECSRAGVITIHKSRLTPEPHQMGSCGVLASSVTQHNSTTNPLGKQLILQPGLI